MTVDDSQKTTVIEFTYVYIYLHPKAPPHVGGTATAVRIVISNVKTCFYQFRKWHN